MAQPRAQNGFSAGEVDDALRGVNTGDVEYRIRFDLLDLDNNLLRAITNVVDGEVRHSSEQLIKRTAHFTIEEEDLDLDDFDTQVIDAGPLVFWSLNDTSGTTAIDTSGNSRNGTYHGSPILNAPSLLAGDTGNGSVTFDGSQYVDTAHVSAYNVSSITVACWIQTSSTGAYQILASRDDAVTNRSWQFRLNPSNQLEFMMMLPGEVSFTSAATITDGLPHFLVATYDGANVIMYVDSIRVYKQAETRTLASASVALVFASRAIAGVRLIGGGQKFAYYGRALTGTEVRNMYQKGVDDLNEIDYLRDRIRPWVGVKMEEDGTDGTPWVEFPVGVFVLANPRRVGTDTGTERDVQGFDQSVILLNDRVSTRYTVNSSTNYITAVGTVLTSAGFSSTNYSLTTTTLTLPSTREWIAGTAKLDIINDLLNAINYRPLYFNGLGQAVAEPFVLPASRAVEVTYNADLASMIRPEIELTTNLFEIPNTIILSRTNPKTGNLNGTAVNTALSSPTSTIRVGRTITYFDGNIDAADQSTITALAERMLTEKSQIYQTVRLSTWLAPYHEDLDKITLVDPTLSISGDFIEYEWTLPLVETGDMQHVLRYVVDVV